MNNRNRRGETFVLNATAKWTRVAALSMVFTLCLGGTSGLALGQVTQARADASPVDSDLNSRQAPAGTPTADLATEDLYKRVLPSIMTVVVEKPEGLSTGTAFLVIKDGLALT